MSFTIRIQSGTNRGVIYSILVLLISVAPTLGQVGNLEPALPGFDKRSLTLSPVTLTPDRQKAATELLARAPHLTIDYDDITGAPSCIASVSGFLTGPDNEEEILPRTVEAMPKSSDEDPLPPPSFY